MYQITRNLDEVVVYLDDTPVRGPTQEDHFKNLRRLLQILKENKL